MDKIRILVVGLEPEDINSIKDSLGLGYLVIAYDMLPTVKLVEGVLFVESKQTFGKYLKVDKVIFHGIFEDDFDFITLLALWNGACLPNSMAMMDLRKRIPGLVKSLRVSKFGGIKRSMAINTQEWESEKEVVAKWGIWHCGEDKHKFNGNWVTKETSVIEEFIEGEAVRIMIIGDNYWQIKLTGDSWLKSIHNKGSDAMEVDIELLEDSKKIASYFNLEMVGIDYMLGKNGDKYLLEVNHIPNVTVFPFINKAFIEYAKDWILISTGT